MDIIPYFCLFLSFLITSFNNGFFSIPGVSCLVVLEVLLIILFFRRTPSKSGNNIQKPADYLLPFLLIISFSLLLFFPNGICQIYPVLSRLILFLLIFFYPLILSYV